MLQPSSKSKVIMFIVFAGVYACQQKSEQNSLNDSMGFPSARDFVIAPRVQQGSVIVLAAPTSSINVQDGVLVCFGNAASCNKQPQNWSKMNAQTLNNGKVIYSAQKMIQNSNIPLVVNLYAKPINAGLQQKNSLLRSFQIQTGSSLIGNQIVPNNNSNQGGSEFNIVNLGTNPNNTSQCHKATQFECEAESVIFQLTNQLRVSVGASPLSNDQRIAFVSRDWSKQQMSVSDISHDGFPIMRNAVFRREFNMPISLNGENVASFWGGTPMNPKSVGTKLFATWRGSSGHYQNMVSLEFRSIGVGVTCSTNKGCYGTQIFD